jgi:hypothetical protein
MALEGGNKVRGVGRMGRAQPWLKKTTLQTQHQEVLYSDGDNEVNFEYSQHMLVWGSSPPILLVSGPELAPRPKLQPKLRP